MCRSCPKGSYCPYNDMAVQISCVPGTYSLGNQSACTACPPGYGCPSTTSSSSITKCSSGISASVLSRGELLIMHTFLSSFTIDIFVVFSCTPCPAGYSCSSTTSNVMTPCPSGHYSSSGDGVCSGCQSGYYCPTPTSGQRVCPPGTYSGILQSNCTTCPAGYQCNTVGATKCGVGYYSTAGSIACSPCTPGYMVTYCYPCASQCNLNYL